jgi:hypothetical protein
MVEDYAVIDTPFLQLLEALQPPFSGALDHRKFNIPLKKIQAFMEFLPQAAVVFLVGPSHVGKSLILKYGVRHMRAKVFPGVAENVRPVFGASAMVSRDARTTPKYLLEELLFDLGNPFFDPLARNHGPAKVDNSETTMLRTLRHGMVAMGTRVVLVDEGDYLVRAKDEHFRSLLIEAIKCLVTPLTTVFIAGGYDLLDTVLKGRAHICTRKLFVHVEPYGDSKNDAREWQTIVSSMTRSERFSKQSAAAVRTCADRLRYESHGIIGVLEKRLMAMLADAQAHESEIDQDIIDLSEPTQDEWSTIRLDIVRGAELMQHVGADGAMRAAPGPPKASIKSPKKPSKKTSRAPFTRSPKRQVSVPST